MKGTRYFQGQIERVLTSWEGDLARGTILRVTLEVFSRKNRAATSTENSYMLRTRSKGLRKLVTTDVLLDSALCRMLMSSCVDKSLQLGLLHLKPYPTCQSTNIYGPKIDIFSSADWSIFILEARLYSVIYGNLHLQNLNWASDHLRWMLYEWTREINS